MVISFLSKIKILNKLPHLEQESFAYIPDEESSESDEFSEEESFTQSKGFKDSKYSRAFTGNLSGKVFLIRYLQ